MEKEEGKEVPYEVIRILNKELDIRALENKTREQEIEAKKEIESKSLEYADKDNERKFKAYEIDQKEISKDGSLKRICILIAIISVILIIGYGCFLLYENNLYGERIIISALSFLMGSIGGWGIAQKHKPGS